MCLKLTSLHYKTAPIINLRLLAFYAFEVKLLPQPLKNQYSNKLPYYYVVNAALNYYIILLLCMYPYLLWKYTVCYCIARLFAGYGLLNVIVQFTSVRKSAMKKKLDHGNYVITQQLSILTRLLKPHQ